MSISATDPTISRPPRLTASPDPGRVLVLARDSEWTTELRDTLKRLGLSMRRLDGPVDALASIADCDPVLFIIGDYDGDLSLTDICDAIRIPRQRRPFGLLVTTFVPLLSDTDVSDLGIDDILSNDAGAAHYSATLLQHYRLARMSQRVLEREQEILDGLPDPLCVVDHELRLWKSNAAFIRLVGGRAEFDVRTVLGHPLDVVLSLIAGERSAAFEELTTGLRRAFAERLLNFRCRLDVNDEDRSFSARLTPLQLQGDYVLVDLRDVTEHERGLLADARRERLATIGNLSLGVAHEIQNPNTFSRVNAENLRELIGALKPLLTALVAEHPDRRVGALSVDRALGMIDSAVDGVRVASERIARVLDGLKSYGKSEANSSPTFDPRASVDEAILLTTHIARGVCQVTVDLPEELPLVRGSRVELSQVFVNLIENAVQAYRESHQQTPGRIRLTLESNRQSQVVIAVTDNGPGIDPAIQTKIFRPYFTTRGQADGTGLGLALSSEIIHRMGGDLTVRSRPGHGATFLITLKQANLADTQLPAAEGPDDIQTTDR
jgi:signal transduction histidine kinase